MDERSHADRTRRAGVESAAIRLADGDLWGLARPTPRLKPRVVKDVDALGRPIKTIHVVAEFGYPIEIGRLIDDLRIVCQRGTAEQQHEALFRLTASLIRRAHEIDLEDVVRLFEMSLDELPGFVAIVLSVITGGSHNNGDTSRKADADA